MKTKVDNTKNELKTFNENLTAKMDEILLKIASALQQPSVTLNTLEGRIIHTIQNNEPLELAPIKVLSEYNKLEKILRKSFEVA